MESLHAFRWQNFTAPPALSIWCTAVYYRNLSIAFYFFHKHNSQVADLWARLQRYLLFEIMALGSSKSLKTETNDLFTPFSQGRTKRGLSRAKKPAATAEGAACVPLQQLSATIGTTKLAAPITLCLSLPARWLMYKGCRGQATSQALSPLIAQCFWPSDLWQQCHGCQR